MSGGEPPITDRLEGSAEDDRRTRRDERRRSRRRRRLVLLAAAALAVLVAGVALSSVGSDRIPGKVSIAGVDVGGLTPEGARALVAKRATEIREGRVRVVGDKPGSFSAALQGTALTTRPLLDEAVAEARDARGRLGRIAARLRLAGRHQVPLRFELNDDAVAALVRAADEKLGNAAASATVAVRGEQIVLRRARPGRAVDRRELIARLSELPAAVTVPLREAPPAVDDDDAARAKALAERIAGIARTVTLGNRSATLTARAARNGLRFRAAEGSIEVTLDERVLRSALLRKLRVGERDPRDARLEIRGSRVAVVPSVPGRRFAAAALGAAIIANPEAATVAAKVTTTQPEFTTAKARALGVKEKVSEFTTNYQCCPPRVTNIKRAAAILDRKLIPAGGRFSLNDAIGERTRARGFVSAPQIAAGELVDAVGGGVSQIATTMYNAAFFAGLELVAHTPHEFYISRYPMGREATVSWRSPDLVFRNDWPAAVLISTRATNSGITIAFYSSKLERRVETSTGAPTSRTQPKTVERKNSSLAPGTRKTIQSAGAGGFTVSYTRKVFRGTVQKRNETYRWRYRPQNAIVEVGPPKKPDPPKTPPDSEKPDGKPTPTTPTTPTSPTTPTTPTTTGGTPPPAPTP